MRVADSTERGASLKAPIIWGALFFVGMFGAGIFARTVDLNAFWSAAIMLPPMLLLIPLVRSAERKGAADGCTSAALIRYNRRVLIWSFAYMISLFVAVWLKNVVGPKDALLWFVAALPALPIFYFAWTLHRYLIEENDEYIRQRYINHALFGLVLLLVLATFWGFLESFELVRHAPGWLALPVWAIGLGLPQIWQKVRGA